jgi:hypothetical protein
MVVSLCRLGINLGLELWLESQKYAFDGDM